MARARGRVRQAAYVTHIPTNSVCTQHITGGILYSKNIYYDTVRSEWPTVVEPLMNRTDGRTRWLQQPSSSSHRTPVACESISMFAKIDIQQWVDNPSKSDMKSSSCKQSHYFFFGFMPSLEGRNSVAISQSCTLTMGAFSPRGAVLRSTTSNQYRCPL